MNLRRLAFLALTLGMMAAFGGCGSSTKKTLAPEVTITANSGYTSAAAVGTSFGLLAATVTSNGNPVSGATVTFTAPAAGSGVATGTFATNPAAATDTETTNASGVATSQTFSAGTVAGAYTVTATTSGSVGSPANFNLTNNAGSPSSIAAYSGTPQNAVISTAYGALAAQVLDGDGNPVSGLSVTFTIAAGGSGASGVFATSGASDMETTDANGVASTAQALTANATVGSFTVTADYTGDTGPATFNLTNVPVPALAAGTYVFSITGTDSGVNGNGNSQYFAAGAFTTDVTGTITGGEMDFSDAYEFARDSFASGSVIHTGSSLEHNVFITINTGDPKFGYQGNGSLELDANMATSSRGAVVEFDAWASGVGEIDLQGDVSSLCASASSSTPCGYAFVLNGLGGSGLGSHSAPISVGGVIAIDSVGVISGTGSVFDINASCVILNGGNQCTGGTLPTQTVTASTVSMPDAYGSVTISLNSPEFTITPGIQIDGYMVDANHIRLVEDWAFDGTGNQQDGLDAMTGGTAIAQTGTGTFNTASISGSTYVISSVGSDSNGVLQVAGVLTFNSDGSMGGYLSYNDGVLIAPQGGSQITGGTYTVDSSGTGRVTVSGLTDAAADFTYDLQLYLTGDGHATVISMDQGVTNNNDVQGGAGWSQAAGLSASSLSGSYAYGLGQFFSGKEADGVGSVTIVGSSGSVTGYIDVNYSLYNGTTLQEDPLSATFAATSANGVFTVNGSGSPSHLSTMYLIDATQGVIIESDSLQLNLGYFANQ